MYNCWVPDWTWLKCAVVRVKKKRKEFSLKQKSNITEKCSRTFETIAIVAVVCAQMSSYIIFPWAHLSTVSFEYIWIPRRRRELFPIHAISLPNRRRSAVAVNIRLYGRPIKKSERSNSTYKVLLYKKFPSQQQQVNAYNMGRSAKLSRFFTILFLYLMSRGDDPAGDNI